MASTNAFLTLYSTVQTNLVGSTISTGFIPYVSTAGRQNYTSTLSQLQVSTLQGSTIGTNYVSLDTTGVNLITTNTPISITGATYSTSTLLAVISFASTTAFPPVGSWVIIASVAPSGYNGSFLVTASGATSITVQNYTGSTLTYSSGGTITVNSAGTAGLTFGDTSTKTTNRAPIVTIISTNSAVPGTPLANTGKYITPIGAKYLQITMLGAGGGGSNFAASQGQGGIGGNTVFGSIVAYGGCAAIVTGNSYYGYTTYPFLIYYNGGLGGGMFPVVSYVATASYASVSISDTVSNTFYTAPAVGTSFTLTGFVPTQWNGTYTVSNNTTPTTTSFSFATGSTYGAITYYGLLTFNNNTQGGLIYTSGSSGFGTTVNTGTLGGGTIFGNIPATGTSVDGTIKTSPLNNMNVYGAGGAGGGSYGGNTSGFGGGAGGMVQGYITSPATSYTYSIGQGGAGGASDGTRYIAGAGASGVIIVTAYF